MIEGPSTTDDIGGSIGESIDSITDVGTIRSDENSDNTESLRETGDLITGVGAKDVKDGETLGDLSEVDTGTEGSLVSQFTDTSATGVTFFGA